MGKKANKNGKKENASFTLQKTEKFTVIDAPGVSQPSLEAPPTAAPAPGKKAEESSKKSSGQQGRRATAASGPRISSDKQLIGTECFDKRSKNPSWISERLAKFNEIAAVRKEEFAKKERVPISVTLPDGKVLTSNEKKGEAFQAWETTPYDVAASISQGLADSVTVARVTYADFVSDYNLAEDGMEGQDPTEYESEDEGDLTGASGEETKSFLWDLTRPLVGNVSKLELLKFENDEDAKTVFWHSSAHMLGCAMEHLWGSKLTIGPPLKGGFYYDSYMGTSGDANIREDDYKPIEQEFAKITKKKDKFERLVVSKEEALSLFEGNPFKTAIISTKVPDNSRTTVYKCGDLIDLCRGPHIPHTGKVKAFSATRHSATNWLADTEKDSLQRLYGVSFPDKKMLKVWKENQEKAKERDHRRIMQKQELVFFHDLSPGSAFWLPHGTRIYNNLVNFIKHHYWHRGYHEIITPNIFNLDLWHQSGHAMHYKDAMFSFEVEGQEWAMKPMNCPAHCLMYASSIRSYRDLPIRYADFGVLHRNELSGALTGMTRVRRFQQDDGHVFCTEDQIEEEVSGALDFVKSVYNTFGMSYTLELSTRPKKALGSIELWQRAESALARAIDEFIGPGNWKVNPGDGAFYGPKIDIKVMDAMDRVHQCATIQLDFQLPIRFDLTYQTKEQKFERPVLVHRAMLGSVERMFAVLCEHYGGKWPFWMSPRQVMIIPIHAEWNEYCEQVKARLHSEGFYVDIDTSKGTFNKKVRNAQVAQYNYQLVIGEQEVKNGTVNIRTRENKVEGEKKIEELVEMLKDMKLNFK